MLVFLTIAIQDTCYAENNDDNKLNEIDMTFFPIIYYTPETSLGLGVGSIFTYRKDTSRPEDRPDTFPIYLHYTLKNQSFIEINPDIYFHDQKGKLKLLSEYSDMPTSYFGIGTDADIDHDDIENLEEKYSAESVKMELWLIHELYKHLRAGFNYHIDNSRLYDKEVDGRLESERPVGYEGGVLSGIGPVIDWDSRDHIFYPGSGGWYQIWARFYREGLKSDFDFEKYTVDLRHFYTISPNHILALQGIASEAKGEVPFYELPTLEIRGIYEDLFIDNKMITGQIEYRFPLVRRFSGAAFFAAGDVSDSFHDYKLSDIKYGGGFGIRYALNEEERINLRFDFAMSPWGYSPYIQIQESF